MGPLTHSVRFIPMSQGVDRQLPNGRRGLWEGSPCHIRDITRRSLRSKS